mgnify:CR=1 FL=1
MVNTIGPLLYSRLYTAEMGEILRTWSPGRAHFSRTGLLLSGLRGTIQAQKSCIKLISGSSPILHQDILIRNHDILIRDQDIPKGNQDIPIGNQDILIFFQEILILHQDILISYQDFRICCRART